MESKEKTFLVVWTNWDSNSNDMKLFSVDVSPKLILVSDTIFYSRCAPGGRECPSVGVCATSDEDACDKAGRLFDKEKYSHMREEVCK